MNYVEKTDKPRPNWDQTFSSRPTLIDYWYRQSPQYMMPIDFHDAPLLTPGRLFPDDPPTGDFGDDQPQTGFPRTVNLFPVDPSPIGGNARFCKSR